MVIDNQRKQRHDEVIYFNSAMKVAMNQQREINCLTDNIYYEAAHEPRSGKKAVALVTLNRVNNKRFPDTICDVVYEKSKKTCQFSWVCGVNKKYNHSEYSKSMKIAKKVYRDYEKMYDITNGSLYFHADYVNPPWANQKYFVRKIGRHLFYKGIPKRN
jgi:spore germination cell wall hydrolase CwlJ-like protein